MYGLRKQVPSAGFDWLYKDFEENNRTFSKLVYLGVNDMPWDECTESQKEERERQHQPEQEKSVEQPTE